MDGKKVFGRFENQDVFLKTIAKPGMDGAEKAALNRKGNLLFNSGNIEGARRIFLTTGYSDGLARIVDYYKSKGMNLDALRMYWIAPDKKKAASIIVEVSVLIKSFIHVEEDQSDG